MKVNFYRPILIIPVAIMISKELEQTLNQLLTKQI